MKCESLRQASFSRFRVCIPFAKFDGKLFVTICKIGNHFSEEMKTAGSDWPIINKNRFKAKISANVYVTDIISTFIFPDIDCPSTQNINTGNFLWFRDKSVRCSDYTILISMRFCLLFRLKWIGIVSLKYLVLSSQTCAHTTCDPCRSDKQVTAFNLSPKSDGKQWTDSPEISPLRQQDRYWKYAFALQLRNVVFSKVHVNSIAWQRRNTDFSGVGLGITYTFHQH